MVDTPYCSITLSTRNKCDYLRVTLASIRKQTVPFLYEIIVADDGSTDDTKAVCDEFDVQYHHIKNNRYRNPAVARNVAFWKAKGELVIAQSDDIAHACIDSVAALVSAYKPGYFVLGQTHNMIYADDKPVAFIQEFCGPSRLKPYFFFGVLSRSDLYAVGAYDEEFVEPCYDDDWLADCLIHGRGLQVAYTTRVLAHHQSHGYIPHSHDREYISKALYKRKVAAAKKSKVWLSSSGSWPIVPPTQPNQGCSMRSTSLPQLSKTTEAVVPRRMNFFWAGNTMSWMRFMTLYSFRYYHRDWDIVLHHASSDLMTGKTWSSVELQDTPPSNSENYLQHLSSLDIQVKHWIPPKGVPVPLAPSHASDFCEWSELAANGGFYSDMDILYVRSLPYRRLQDADVIFCLTYGYMAIGFFGASAQQQLLQDIFDMAIKNYSATGYQSTGAEAIYRLAGTWPKWGTIPHVGARAIDSLKSTYPGLNLVTTPDTTVYPWHFRKVSSIFCELHTLPPNSCGIHWFGGDPLAQKWNQTLTHDNYRDYPNTFTTHAASMLAEANEA